MRCRVCNVDKLSRECMPYPAAPSCNHPHHVCLRCITRLANEGAKCPYQDCDTVLSGEMEAITEFDEMLKIMFQVIDDEFDDMEVTTDSADATNSVVVLRLTGETNLFVFTPTKTVIELKDEIHRELDIETSKQELLYKERELEKFLNTGERAKLSDYDIQPGSKIILMVLLYAIPKHLNEVTFDLSWNYPATKKDYLDATCFVFKGGTFKDYVDFSRSYMAPASAERMVGMDNKRGRNCPIYEVDPNQVSIRHTSDKHMDDVKRQGKHTIIVYMQRLPKDVTHLFFVLSAWEHPTISHFPNPSLKFYETSRPDVNLCETTFSHALHSSAVIMCSASRKDGQWRVIRSGTLSAGNAKNYGPLKDKIREIIGMEIGMDKVKAAGEGWW